MAVGKYRTGALNAENTLQVQSAVARNYRPDIDGLRALAVLPVVLGHASVRGFSGGFVGVDIFFVISGYLITGILVRDLAAGRYSIAEFYRRRILRIFPVLFAVLATSTLVAIGYLLPTELVRYAGSLGATTLFSSNILFYSESGYFDAASNTKPLLHTWSLAVEEQFYILWPLLLAWIGASRMTLLRLTVAAICMASFVASILFLNINPSATFYLLPTRACELALGAMLALTGNPIRNRWVNDLLGALGLAAILTSIWLYDEMMLFPGAAAALPCGGALLLLMTGASGGWVSRLFSLSPAVFVGKISYSLYMWHWPVIVFAKIAFLQNGLTPQMQVIEIGVSFLLAVLSWKFIERPFRTNVAHWRTRDVFKGALMAMALMIGTAGALLALRGMPDRYSEEQQAVANYLSMDVELAYRRGTCFRAGPQGEIDPSCITPKTRKPVVLLLGDSHAAHLWPGFAQNPGQYEVLQATVAGCRPLIHPDPSTRCRRLFNDMLLKWAPEHRPAVILLSAKWRPNDLELLEKTLDKMASRNLNIVLIGPIPQYTAALPRLLAVALGRGDRDLLRRSLRTQQFTMDRQLREMAERRGIIYVSLIDLLCRGQTCKTLAKPPIPMQFDHGHLTEEGSELVVRNILPYIDLAVERNGIGRSNPNQKSIIPVAREDSLP